MKRHVLQLLGGLDRACFEPVLLCPPHTPLAAEAEAAGIRVLPVSLAGAINPPRDLRALRQVRALLATLQPDILHIHSAKAGWVGRLALGRRRPRVILTLHSFIFDERVGRLQRALIARLERWLARRTDRIIAVSQALKDDLVVMMGLPPAQIAVLYNGLDFADAAPPLPRRAAAPCIGAVARLAPQKGLDCFLRAAALVAQHYPEATFPIIGDGPLRASLVALADELGLADRVSFLGYRADAVALMRAMDIFVLASTHETFGLTVAEALAQEVPVVAADVGGIPEIVEDGVSGLLASPGDPGDFADKTLRLLADPALARQLAQQGSRDVRARFSCQQMLAATESLYRAVLK